MNTPLLTVADVAFGMSVPQSHVRRMVRNHGLPHVTLPTGEVRFSERDLSRWIEERKEPALQGAGERSL